ncbi:MAG: hypothetical protein N2F24_06030, partial [Deltaproteobacteria bacterium]
WGVSAAAVLGGGAGSGATGGGVGVRVGGPHPVDGKPQCCVTKDSNQSSLFELRRDKVKFIQMPC